MHTTVRRYEGIDQSRKSELAKKVGENLLPRLSKMPGFNGYYLIDAEQDVMSSISFFDTSAQADAVDSLRRQLVARGEARERAPEFAEDHRRRGHRPQDERRGQGVSARLDARKARG